LVIFLEWNFNFFKQIESQKKVQRTRQKSENPRKKIKFQRKVKIPEKKLKSQKKS
jgi:hypothetical protein